MRENFEKGISVLNLIITVAIILACFFIYSSFTNNTEVTTSTANEIELSNDTSIKTIISDNSSSVNNSQPKSSSTENITLNANIIGTSTETQTNTSSSEYSKFYYSQIDSIAKKMYDTILANEDKLISGTESIKFNISEEGADEHFQTAWDALCMDHPELFFVDTNKLSLKTRTTTSFFGAKVTYEYFLEPLNGGTYYIDSFQSEQDVNQAIATVNAYVSAIANEANNKQTTYDKVKYVHDYIITNTSYDQTDGINSNNLYGCLVNHTAVCEGYADAFKYILDKLQIPCVMVFGNGVKGDGSQEYHSWNYVKMEDGNWYAVDTTWDDPIVIGNGVLPEREKYVFFLKGKRSFATRHIEQNDVSGTGQNFTYPTLSDRDYR